MEPKEIAERLNRQVRAICAAESVTIPELEIYQTDMHGIESLFDEHPRIFLVYKENNVEIIHEINFVLRVLLEIPIERREIVNQVGEFLYVKRNK